MSSVDTSHDASPVTSPTSTPIRTPSPSTSNKYSPSSPGSRPTSFSAKSSVHIAPDGTKYYTNTNLLYVKSGVASNDQLAQSMRKALADVSKKLDRKVVCTFKPNLIVGRNNVYYGFGYIWVTNPEVYHMLLGRNPDGSERVEYIDDLNWEEPEESLNDALKKTEFSGNWADDSSLEESITSQYQRPQFRKVLSPLMVLPGYSYDKEQLKHIAKIKDEDENSPYQPEENKSEDVLGYFSLSPAFVKDPDPKYCANVLCTRNVPDWVTESMLKTEFTPYASDSKNKVLRKVKGQKIEDTYPFVTINDKRVAFITFDPDTRDASFCVLMTKRVILTSGRKECMLVFNFSYRSLPQAQN